MRKFLFVLLLVAAMTPACARLGAGPSSTGSGVGISSAEIAKQDDGVATALANLPKAPDANVQAQIEGYAAWGAFLAKAAAVVVGAL
jgi:hypothetical protein